MFVFSQQYYTYIDSVVANYLITAVPGTISSEWRIQRWEWISEVMTPPPPAETIPVYTRRLTNFSLTLGQH